MEWISVKDRLPPDDWDLQVMARMDGVEFPEHAHFICRYPDDYSDWQPLPPPPNASTGRSDTQWHSGIYAFQKVFHPLGDSMIDLEELKRRRFKMHAEWTPEGQEASAEQFAMLKEFDRQFPAIVAKLEAAQRLRDAVVGHFGTEGILKWPEIAGSVVAFNRADKEQQ